MASQNIKHKRSSQSVGFYLAGSVLLMLLFQVEASTGQQTAQDQASAQPEGSTPVWIQDPYTGDNVLTYIGEHDKSLWNAKRITDYEDSLKVKAKTPLGIFTIEKLNIRVPIFNGTTEYYLNRGVSLKDIQLGDDIEIQTTRGVESYEVSSITIIPKSDISILEPTTEKTLTIVTCYPFYFVGHAPKRYIVKATVKDSSAE